MIGPQPPSLVSTVVNVMRHHLGSPRLTTRRQSWDDLDSIPGAPIGKIPASGQAWCVGAGRLASYATELMHRLFDDACLEVPRPDGIRDSVWLEHPHD